MSDLEDSSSLLAFDDDETRNDACQSILATLMTDQPEQQQLYEYLFQHDDDDDDDWNHRTTPSLVATSHGEEEDDPDDSSFLSCSTKTLQLQQRLHQTQDALRHQRQYIHKLERQFRRTRLSSSSSLLLSTPTSSTTATLGPGSHAVMTTDASRRFLSVVQDLKTQHARELQDWKRKYQTLFETQTPSRNDTTLVSSTSASTSASTTQQQPAQLLESLQQEEARPNLVHLSHVSEQLADCQDSLVPLQRRRRRRRRRRTDEVQRAEEPAKVAVAMSMPQHVMRHADALSHALEQCQSELQAVQEQLVKERTVQGSLKEQLEQCQEELLSTKEAFTLKEKKLEEAKQSTEEELEECRLELLQCRERLSGSEREVASALSKREELVVELESCQRDLQVRGEKLVEDKRQLAALTDRLGSTERALKGARGEADLFKSQLKEERDRAVKEREEHRQLQRFVLEMQETWTTREQQHMAELSRKEHELAEGHKLRETLQEELAASYELVSAVKDDKGSVRMQTGATDTALEDSDSDMPSDYDEESRVESDGDNSRSDQQLYPSADTHLEDTHLEVETMTMITPISTENSSFVHHSILTELLMGNGLTESASGEDRTVLQQLEAMSNFLDRVDIHEYLQESDNEETTRSFADATCIGEVETVPLTMYLDLQQRLDIFEEERGILLTETLDLLESAREANAVEMDVFQAEVKEQTAKKIKEQVDEQVIAVLGTFTQLGLNPESIRSWKHDTAQQQEGASD